MKTHEWVVELEMRRWAGIDSTPTDSLPFKMTLYQLVQSRTPQLQRTWPLQTLETMLCGVILYKIIFKKKKTPWSKTRHLFCADDIVFRLPLLDPSHPVSSKEGCKNTTISMVYEHQWRASTLPILSSYPILHTRANSAVYEDNWKGQGRRRWRDKLTHYASNVCLYVAALASLRGVLSYSNMNG